MRWINHTIQGVAIGAAIDPAGIPFAVLGATAPDWLEMVSKRWGRLVSHRGITHYLVFWLLLIFFAIFVWDLPFHPVLLFGVGGLVHWLGDSLTVSGAPVGWWSSRRITLLGGKLRTGGSAEYFVTIAIVVVAALVIAATGGSGFLPFFRNWGVYYERGLLSGAEWFRNRFNLF